MAEQIAASKHQQFSEGHLVYFSDKLKQIHYGVAHMETAMKFHLSRTIRQTHLHIAAAKGHSGVIRELCKQNPFMIDARNYRGVTPLHVCIWHGHIEAVNQQIACGASIYETAPNGLTVIHLAVIRRNYRLSKILLANDVAKKLINQLNCDGDTALHIAVRQMDEELVKLFIAMGFDSNMKNYSGKTCIDMAVETQQRNIFEILQHKHMKVGMMEIGMVTRAMKSNMLS